MSPALTERGWDDLDFPEIKGLPELSNRGRGPDLGLPTAGGECIIDLVFSKSPRLPGIGGIRGDPLGEASLGGTGGGENIAGAERNGSEPRLSCEMTGLSCGGAGCSVVVEVALADQTGTFGVQERIKAFARQLLPALDNEATASELFNFSA